MLRAVQLQIYSWTALSLDTSLFGQLSRWTLVCFDSSRIRCECWQCQIVYWDISFQENNSNTWENYTISTHTYEGQLKREWSPNIQFCLKIPALVQKVVNHSSIILCSCDHEICQSYDLSIILHSRPMGPSHSEYGRGVRYNGRCPRFYDRIDWGLLRMRTFVGSPTPSHACYQ